MAKSGKGSEFERSFCKKLSLWWTKGQREDIFWRTAGSGARAKIRGRKGKLTDGQHGDVAFTDPLGKPLIDLLLIELKCGYSKDNIQTLLDLPDRLNPQAWEQWIRQATDSLSMSKSWYWLIVSKRNGRNELITMESDFFEELIDQECFKSKPNHYLRMTTSVRNDNKQHRKQIEIVCFLLSDWFELIRLKKLKRFANQISSLERIQNVSIGKRNK